MRFSKRIALVVDHPRRDLAGLLLTAYHLCKLGATCHLVPFNLQRKEIWALRPDFVLLNYARRGANEDFGRDLLDAGIKFGVLDTEGGVWPNFEDYTRLLWKDRSLLKSMSCYCAWGQKLGRHLTENKLLPPALVNITGCPRFDLYHPAWRPLVEEGKAGNGLHIPPRFLINTNFSDANPRFKGAKEQVEIMLSMGYDHEEIRQMIHLQEKAIAGVIVMTRSLAADFPNIRIVLRPHPFEDPERYARELGCLQNVEVNVDGPVQNQIFASAAVIQRSCTTAVESAIAGVPTFSPQWIPASMLMQVSEAVSDPCENYDCLRELLRQVLSGTYAVPESIREAKDAAIRDWFTQVDGECASRIAGILNSVAEAERTVDEQYCARLLYGVDTLNQDVASDLGTTLRYRFKLSPDWSFRRLRCVPRRPRADKAIHVEDADRLLKKIELVSLNRGGPASKITVWTASERGDYACRYTGSSLTLALE